MTKEEVQKSSGEKVKKVEALCKGLELIVSAEQMINERGIIKQVVFYTDIEKYEMDEEPVTPKTDEPKKDEV